MTAPALLPVATLPVVRDLLDQARAKGYVGGVVGARAQPQWDGPAGFEHADRPVRVVPCRSVLAVREALLTRSPERWLVVLTDRADSELGTGIKSHLVGQRLLRADPWDAVRGRFAAATLEASLKAGADNRELAAGVLAGAPTSGGWPPAPSGVLTREHLLRSVAAEHLDLPAPPASLDAATVLAWTAGTGSAQRLAALRALSGALADAVLVALSGACGSAAPAVQPLLCRGGLAEVVPLGLVVDVLLDRRDESTAREALVRLESRFAGTLPPDPALRALAQECRALVGVVEDPDRLLRAADDGLVQLHAQALAESSDLLPSALAQRLLRLAEALRGALDRQDLRHVEAAWSLVHRHRLAAVDPRVPAFAAAVRLVRWLSLDGPGPEPASSLPALVSRHLTQDCWVDAATSAAARGSADPALGGVLAAVLEAVHRRRAPHDEAFATALAAATRADDLQGLTGLEDLLPGTVLPLARQVPVLLLVCDGMSAAVGAGIVASVTGSQADGWAELLPPDSNSRRAAVAVLPTLTRHSRASLLSGQLTSGEQAREQTGYASLCSAAGLSGALFHKKALDESPPGQAVAPVVGAAVDDVSGVRLVTCVLNTIDDSLDRSDPGGTDWGLDTVKHLRPLLERARFAGRVVVLTSDRGHVVERRQGRMLPVDTMTSGRSRAPQPPAGPGEVLVQGRRVHDGAAVLAVDELVRYGPLKAGYHGGASPAEVVVPVAVLSVGEPPARWRVAGPQEPAWWWTDPPVTVATAPTLTLFEVAGETMSAGRQLAVRVLASPVYAAQRARASRSVVREDQVQGLLAALLDAPARRLGPQQAAAALAEAPSRLRFAVPQVQQLLNVEGYPVLQPDADGVTLLLDEALLREQFEVA